MTFNLFRLISKRKRPTSQPNPIDPCRNGTRVFSAPLVCSSNGGRQFLRLPAAAYEWAATGFAGVYGMIQAQAAMLASNDIYRTLAIAMVFLIPFFLLLRRGAASSATAH
jgi:hypothetical protein